MPTWARERGLTPRGTGRDGCPRRGPARRPTHLITDHTRDTMVAPFRAQGHCSRPPLPVSAPHRPRGIVVLVCRKGLWEWESVTPQAPPGGASGKCTARLPHSSLGNVVRPGPGGAAGKRPPGCAVKPEVTREDVESRGIPRWRSD